MLRLHHAPLACSLASRLALIETGLPFELSFVRTDRGENRTEAYLRLNPRGQVPVLETDDGVLTESTAILPYIADLAPDKQLFPAAGSFARAQGQAWLSFLSSTLHVSIASALFPVEGDSDAAREARMAKMVAAFKDVDAHLVGRDHLLDAFSVCDLYLLVFAVWRGAPQFGGGLPALPNLDLFQQKMFGRPGFPAILGEEMQMRAGA